MLRQGKAVSSSCLPIRIALRHDDGSDGFRILMLRRGIAQDSGESKFTLWRGNVRSGEVGEMLL